MQILSKLMEIPGVVAGGEFSYKGEILRHKGNLSDAQARLVATLCLANTRSANTQAEIYCAFDPVCGVKAVPGWMVRGSHHTVVTIGSHFAFVDNNNAPGTLNQVADLLRHRYDHPEEDGLVRLYQRFGGDIRASLLT
ncbi:MAG: DUF2173 family protein [Betaproteobacteria bacterium]|nr:DUF2173 family protein [Betaproteobacteria bacterium]